MPVILAKTSDVLARVHTSLLRSGAPPAAVATQEQHIAALLSQVDSRGQGTLSKAEVQALGKRDAAAGAQVAKAFELLTGRHVELAPATAATSHSLASQLPADWRSALKGELEKPYFKALERFVTAERAHGHVEPPAELVFAALKRTPVSKVKAVLLGQDPYPTAGNANGLSFSVPAGKPVPASLKNMFETLHKDTGDKVPNNGGLEPWADQGVLLLNTVLTVREREPNSHKDHGWETFTRAILDVVNAKQERVVFLLLGKQAQQVAGSVATPRHAVVAVPHPSPMSPGNPFGKTRPFSAVNKALREGGRPEINWQIPDA